MFIHSFHITFIHPFFLLYVFILSLICSINLSFICSFICRYVSGRAQQVTAVPLQRCPSIVPIPLFPPFWLQWNKTTSLWKTCSVGIWQRYWCRSLAVKLIDQRGWVQVCMLCVWGVGGGGCGGVCACNGVNMCVYRQMLYCCLSIQ